VRWLPRCAARLESSCRSLRGLLQAAIAETASCACFVCFVVQNFAGGPGGMDFSGGDLSDEEEGERLLEPACLRHCPSLPCPAMLDLPFHQAATVLFVLAIKSLNHPACCLDQPSSSAIPCWRLSHPLCRTGPGPLPQRARETRRSRMTTCLTWSRCRSSSSRRGSHSVQSRALCLRVECHAHRSDACLPVASPWTIILT